MFWLYGCGPSAAVRVVFFYVFMFYVFFNDISIFYRSTFKNKFCSWNWNDNMVLTVSLSGLYKSLKIFIWPELLNAGSLCWDAYRKCSWHLMLILKFAYILKRGLQHFGLTGETHVFFYSSLGLWISEHQSLLMRVWQNTGLLVLLRVEAFISEYFQIHVLCWG